MNGLPLRSIQDNHRPGSYGSMLLATMLVGVAGAFISIAMPGILMALSQNVDFPPDRAARFASFELGGMFVSTLFLGQILNTRHRRSALAMAMIAIIIGNGASAAFYRSESLPYIRVLSGLGSGLAVAALGAAAASFRSPDRLFATFLSVNMTLVTLYLFFLPRVISTVGVPGAFVILAGAGVLALAALPFFPTWYKSERAAAVTPTHSSRSVLPAASVLGLLGCFALNLGVGMIWPFMGELGKARSVPPEAISTYLAMSTIAGIAAGIGAAVLALRLGRRLPLGLATLGLTLSATGLTLAGVSFALCTILFLFFWTFAVAYYMGTVAAVPDNGRGAVLIPAAQQGGLALGPLLSALVATRTDLPWTVVTGSAICGLGAVAALLANSRTFSGTPVS